MSLIWGILEWSLHAVGYLLLLQGAKTVESSLDSQILQIRVQLFLGDDFNINLDISNDIT